MSNIKELECPVYNDELDNVGNEREKVKSNILPKLLGR